MGSGYRLTKRSQFEETRRKGKSWANPYIVLQAAQTGHDQSRVGFTVGKWLGNAVKRNAIRRRLREIIRVSVLSPGWDLVFIARRDASTASFHELRDAVIQVLTRARLLQTTESREEAQ